MSNDDESKLDADLRVKLAQLFALGFLEAQAGCELEGDDEISINDGDRLMAMAFACIKGGEDLIHANYTENPQMVHDRIYAAGRLVGSEVVGWDNQRN